MLTCIFACETSLCTMGNCGKTRRWMGSAFSQHEHCKRKKVLFVVVRAILMRFFWRSLLDFQNIPLQIVATLDYLIQ